MVRDCLLCNNQGLDSWFGKSSAETSRAVSSLKLGINERYRSAIVLAAQRTGLDPAGIAAVINAEAARVSDSKTKAKLADGVLRDANPNRDWDKRPLNAKDPADASLIKAWKALFASSAWDPKSYNQASGAAGMTQFLAGTWIDEAKRSTTYLNGFAKAKGFLDKQGDILGSKEAELLELRYDPTLSIVASAEYDKYALDSVFEYTVQDGAEADKVFFTRHPERNFSKNPLGNSKDGALIKEWKQILNTQPGKTLIPKELTSDQKARYLYLCHHEGDKGAIQILSGSLTDNRAKRLLKDNVPNEDARSALVKEHGSESKAYIEWLWSYIDQHIQPRAPNRLDGRNDLQSGAA